MFNIDPQQLKLHHLIETIADQVLEDGKVLIALDDLDLQPTSTAAKLAAQAAVSVLLAHDAGQAAAQNTGRTAGQRGEVDRPMTARHEHGPVPKAKRAHTTKITCPNGCGKFIADRKNSMKLHNKRCPALAAPTSAIAIPANGANSNSATQELAS